MARSQQPLSPRMQALGGCRAFLLFGVLILGHATYKLYEYSEFENQQGAIKLMFDNRLYVSLYESGGKWLVFGVILTAALICLASSFFLWRFARKLPPD